MRGARARAPWCRCVRVHFRRRARARKPTYCTTPRAGLLRAAVPPPLCWPPVGGRRAAHRRVRGLRRDGILAGLCDRRLLAQGQLGHGAADRPLLGGCSGRVRGADTVGGEGGRGFAASSRVAQQGCCCNASCRLIAAALLFAGAAGRRRAGVGHFSGPAGACWRQRGRRDRAGGRQACRRGKGSAACRSRSCDNSSVHKGGQQ